MDFSNKLKEFVTEWNSDFCIGIGSVDEEHKIFFDIMDKVFIAANTGYKEFEMMFQSVVSHLAWHFKNEEEYMLSAGLSTKYIESHRKIHSQCIYQLGRMKESILKKNSENDIVYQKELALNLAYFVKNWLIFHIVGEDSKIKKLVDIMEQGNSSERAYAIMTENVDKNIEILTVTLANLLRIYEIRNQKLLEIEDDIKTSLNKKESQLQEQIEENKRKSITDELTGLPNRRQAMSVINNIWNEYQEPVVAIMQVDLDKFKQVNDTFGHHAGDLVLKQFAGTIKNFIQTDELCNKYNYNNRDMVHFCRLGGDEFLVILQKYSIEEAVRIANNIHMTVNNIIVYDEHKEVIWRGSTSIGVACRNAENQDYESVLKTADKYLYRAKEDGRNCVRSILNDISTTSAELY